MTNKDLLYLIPFKIVKLIYLGDSLIDNHYFLMFNLSELQDINKNNLVFVMITNGLFSNDNKSLVDFLSILKENQDIVKTGTKDFKINKDYWLSETLYKEYFAEIDDSSIDDSTIDDSSLSNNTPTISYLPDYYVMRYTVNNIVDSYIDFNSDYYDDLQDINNKDEANIDWFYRYNKQLDNEYTEDELAEFNKTFMSIIKNDAKRPVLMTSIDNIYEYVINYFSNGGYDNGTLAIQTILGSTMTMTNQKMGCESCNKTMTSETTINDKSCIDLYKQSIMMYLSDMLSNHKFYCDWFMIPIDGKCPIPNTPMIDALIKLIDELLESNFDIIGSNKNFGKDKCNCPNIYDTDSIDSNVNPTLCSNENILLNYKKVLLYVKNNKILENVNKINIYGKQFAKLLPQLSF